MKILAGGPAVDIAAEYFLASKASIRGQQTKHDLDVKYILDHEGDGFEVTETNHVWTDDSIHRVGWMRQQFLDLADSEGYDAAWLVDTDLICGPRTLELMLDVDAPIVFGVFWTQWENQPIPLPQVWDKHPYAYDWVPHPEDPEKRVYPTIEALAAGKELEVMGGGACTLIRREAFGKALYHPPLRGMNHWGEDRDFCTRAQVHGLRMVATGRVKVVHLYSSTQRTPEAIAQAQQLVGIE